MAITLLWYPLSRTSAHLEINYNEGWNAYRSQMVASGVPLYGSPPVYTITNYPPLSFHLIGFLSKFTDDLTVSGRLVSLFSFAAIGLLIGAIVHQFTGSSRAAVGYAALSFFVWLAAYRPDRIGMNDPQLLGLAFSALGLYLYVRKPHSNGWLCWSAVVFSISLFIKHNLLALPCAVGAHLVFTAPRRLAVWSAALALAVGVLVLLTIGIDGSYFWSHLVTPRAYSYRHGWNMIGSYLLMFQVSLAAAAVWSLFNAASFSRNILSIGVLFANIVAFGFVGGDGVDGNIFFDSIILLAIITAIALCDIAPAIEKMRFSGLLFTILLFLPFASVLATLPQEVSSRWTARRAIPKREEEFARAVEFLRARPGPALCEDLLLCYDAGKPYFYDTFFVNDQITIGRVRQTEVLEMLETHRFRTIEIDLNPGEPLEPQERLRFSEAFMRSLLDNYQLAARDSNFAFLVPKGE